MARRDKGEGSYYTETVKGGHTRWVYQTYHQVDGERRKIRGYGATKQEARRRHSQTLAKRLTGGFKARTTRHSCWTLSEGLDQWLDVFSAGVIGEASKKAYRGNIQRNVIAHLGDKRLDEITPDELATLFNETLPTTAGPSAASHTRVTLNTLLRLGVEQGQILQNPLARVKARPKVTAVEEDDRFWVAARTNIFLSMIKWAEETDDPDLTLLYLMRLGLRRGEILGLEWNCVTQLTKKNHASVVIRQQFAYHNGAFCIVPRTKTGKSRAIPLPEDIRKHLLKKKRTRPEAKRPEFNDLICLKSNGYTINPNRFAEHWRKLQDRYYEAKETPKEKRKYWRAHYNRHITASLLAKQGTSLNTAAELLGHTDTATTARIYTKTDSEQKRDAVRRLTEKPVAKTKKSRP